MKTKKINPCIESRYREFPEVLFGKSCEDDMVYFDATHYLEQKRKTLNDAIETFEQKSEMFISALCEVYEMSKEEIIVRDEKTGHLLIEESLALLFVAYIDPGFAVYMLERLSEMLLTGLVLSDSAIAIIVRERFTRDDVSDIFENSKN
jgi:hypothetical protein